MPRSPMKRRNILANRTVTVNYARNGLTFDVAGVPAPDGALVAKALMDAVRGLIEAGYEELVQDAGSLHHTPIDQPEEEDGEDFKLPPEARRQRPKLGFTP